MGGAQEVAPLLLNKLLVAGERVGRIVETEAYAGAEDPASHAHRGPTARNSSMFATAGTLYTYLSYGIHTCANVVTGPEGVGGAVLLRALEPILGLESMWSDRPGVVRERDLANGPGKLCRAMGIALADDGTDLCDPHSRVRICTDGTPPPGDPARTPRIGISRATSRRWRFVVPGSSHASRPERSGGGNR
ncbi:MAG: DNA-3-methyladenine glycosylase [Microthrixaceae bacterium]|nr:DNA-3-methyladenine glycosylase [Microthrixaceae bacterium]